MKRIIALAAAFSLAAGTAAFAKDMIDTSNVKVKGDTVTFSEVMANAKGYLVIHDMKNGKPVEPGSIGHTWIRKGDNKMVKVTTTKRLKPGHTYLAMLHKDTNNNRKFDFGKGSTNVDTPMKMNGKPVTKKFTVPSK